MSSAFGKATWARRSVSVALGEPPWVMYRRLVTSRGRASCSSFIAASMVGMRIVAVIRCWSIVSSARDGSNPGSMTCWPAFHTVASTAMVPARWNIGATTSHRVSTVNGQIAK